MLLSQKERFSSQPFQMFWLGDKELILIQNSSGLEGMEDKSIYLIIIDSSKREIDKRMDLWTSENVFNCD
jgi:hypothetical protein